MHEQALVRTKIANYKILGISGSDVLRRVEAGSITPSIDQLSEAVVELVCPARLVLLKLLPNSEQMGGGSTRKPGLAVSHSLDEAEAHAEEEGPAYAETGFLVMLALLPSVGSLLGVLSFGWLLSREGRQSLVVGLLSSLEGSSSEGDQLAAGLPGDASLCSDTAHGGQDASAKLAGGEREPAAELVPLLVKTVNALIRLMVNFGSGVNFLTHSPMSLSEDTHFIYSS